MSQVRRAVASSYGSPQMSMPGSRWQLGGSVSPLPGLERQSVESAAVAADASGGGGAAATAAPALVASKAGGLC
eukprot:CAMPEP_0117668380 /NCGR_PEP_ID=MMETSP0804-20121206/11515_1 /TAXON_ID=1074897 /ORGANISM="Tetraselmis astigmatica, Strain CCMP880" /LENGTH=73 /DNA_ID=CAMNT_0005476261 /DNA_START=118 /DNA_END=339 /DNA_ORIENTATION=-